MWRRYPFSPPRHAANAARCGLFLIRRSYPLAAGVFPHLRSVAELPKGLSARSVRRQPIFDELVDLLFKMRLDLRFEIAVKLLRSQVSQQAFHDSENLMMRLRPSI